MPFVELDQSLGNASPIRLVSRRTAQVGVELVNNFVLAHPLEFEGVADEVHSHILFLTLLAGSGENVRDIVERRVVLLKPRGQNGKAAVDALAARTAMPLSLRLEEPGVGTGAS